MDARFPRIEALGSIGRTMVGDPAVYGDYGGAGIDVEVPLFTGGLFSARQKEATLKATSQTKIPRGGRKSGGPRSKYLLG